MPSHTVITEVSQWVADGGEFPVQHGHDFVVGWMKHQVV